jgi:hypothetical protein
LAETPAVIRFLSVEPLLGPVSLVAAADSAMLQRLHWVIAGGESGQRARPMHPAWARTLRDESKRLGMAFFFKQFGTWELPVPGKKRKTIGLMPNGTRVAVGTPGSIALQKLGKKLAGELLDGRLHQEFPTQDSSIPGQGHLPFDGPGRKAA